MLDRYEQAEADQIAEMQAYCRATAGTRHKPYRLKVGGKVLAYYASLDYARRMYAAHRRMGRLTELQTWGIFGYWVSL